MTISVVLVPFDDSQPLELKTVSWDEDNGGESFQTDIRSLIEEDDVLETALMRPRSNGAIAGLYAYHNKRQYKDKSLIIHNIRATRLAMSCGMLSTRLEGNVLLVRSFGGRWENLSIDSIYAATCITPDLRPCIIHEMGSSSQEGHNNKKNESAEVNEAISKITYEVPIWLADAAQHNYHDGAVLARVAAAMTGEDDEDTDEDDDDDNNNNNSGSDNDGDTNENDNSEGKNKSEIITSNANATSMGENESKKSTEFVARSSLCLHCRRLCSTICQNCHGAYFCQVSSADESKTFETNNMTGTNRQCLVQGWSHFCLCSTWKVYSLPHRIALSNFPISNNHKDEVDDTSSCFGDWQKLLVGVEFQRQEQPYADFLKSLGISATDEVIMKSDSWWKTELYGWAGGQSLSAKQINPTIRQSYLEGFAPITDVPLEQRPNKNDYERAGLHTKKNYVGITKLSCWKDYYNLRNLSDTSPIALLCTFPLTIYHAIERYGEVPVTVARMLKRPLRIHVVGTEKEMNFLDLFKEVGYLLPEDIQLELVFIIRHDMLPGQCLNDAEHGSGKFSMTMKLLDNLTIGVVSGTYAGNLDDSSLFGKPLDPNFDVGTGPPDMLIGLNAGLYAYESWRSVVSYLYQHTGVVGVFTDYNEYSGVNCAAMGGGKSRNSLTMNPFRQPRAMPVYSMALPQFSNGFMYVFNEQELD